LAGSHVYGNFVDPRRSAAVVDHENNEDAADDDDGDDDDDDDDDGDDDDGDDDDEQLLENHAQLPMGSRAAKHLYHLSRRRTGRERAR